MQSISVRMKSTITHLPPRLPLHKPFSFSIFVTTQSSLSLTYSSFSLSFSQTHMTKLSAKMYGRGSRNGGQGSSSSSAPASRLSSELEQRLVLQPRPPDTPQPPPPAVQAKPAAAASSSKAVTVKFPPRPSYGTAGTRCLIRANHFLVELTGRDLYHYDVKHLSLF